VRQDTNKLRHVVDQLIARCGVSCAVVMARMSGAVEVMVEYLGWTAPELRTGIARVGDAAPESLGLDEPQLEVFESVREQPTATTLHDGIHE
jgi:hypothetical protein